ncbi:MAG: hypothetical protein QXJ31_05475 [Candidatus Bathyarchaeia archaeon]
MSKSTMPLEKTISLLFDPKTRNLATTLLIEIKNRQDTNNPYKSNEYQQFCKKYGFEQSTYYSVLSKLREYGIVYKSGGHHEGVYRINSYFIFQLLKEWMEFLGVEYSNPLKKLYR